VEQNEGFKVLLNLEVERTL